MRYSARFATFVGASALVALAATPIAAHLQQRASYDKSFWSGMRYRSIGPARGGPKPEALIWSDAG